MRLLDANLFLHAYNADSPKQESAAQWLEETLSGTETVALSWSVLLAFLRVSTSPRVYRNPLDVSEALDIVESWLEQPCTTIVNPTPRHHVVLKDLLGPLGTAGNLTSDAHLAALAIEHGADLCSSDGDFARFPGLSWINPIA